MSVRSISGAGTVHPALAWPASPAGQTHTAFAGEAAFDILSCDIFDTAIRRRLARPEDVWCAVGLRAASAGITTCAPEEYAQHRATAAARVRARIEQAGGDEPQMLEITAELAACGVVNDAHAAEALEFATECAICEPVPDIAAALNDRAAAGRRIIFLSDSPWPGRRLTALLRCCGYQFDFQVFSSADLRRSKHSGRLFPAVLQALGGTPGGILHIGDNPISDVERPRTYGITARHVPARRPHPARAGCAIVRLAESHANTRNGAARNGATVNAAADGAWLAALATPLLLGFCLFVLARARALGINRLYFLARDGYLPLRICRLLTAGSGEIWDLQYLRVSRAALSDADNARAYLASSGFTAPGPRLLIDLGWNGTQQARLAELCALPDGDLHGAYLGVWQTALQPALRADRVHAYLVQFGVPRTDAELLRESYIVLELLFSAPHGSVLAYQGGEPVIDPEPGPAGDARRRFFNAFETNCLAIATAVAGFIENGWPAHIRAADAIAPLRDVLVRPSKSEFARINAITFIHGNGALLPAVNPIPWHEWLRQPGRSLRRLENAPWRAGAMRAVLPGFIPHPGFGALQAGLRRLGLT
jgi:FMN phosphatase YigB (HAD superfamily)